MTHWNKPCCYNCHYHDEPNGQCRKYPPQVIQHPKIDSLASRFPQVNDNDWCGEFKWKGEEGGREQRS